MLLGRVHEYNYVTYVLVFKKSAQSIKCCLKYIKVLLRYLEADEAHLVVCGLAELLAEGEDESLLLVPLHQGQHAQDAVQHTLHLHNVHTSTIHAEQFKF